MRAPIYDLIQNVNGLYKSEHHLIKHVIKKNSIRLITYMKL